MSRKDHDSDYFCELFAVFGPVTIRRMFGGLGIYAEDVMFALSSAGAIYLKVDDHTVGSFQQHGSTPFTYATKEGTRSIMSYWRMPDQLYDDADELARWAREAVAAAHRAGAPAKPSRSKRRPA
ncbi:MAG: TfoX/Sxy family protein [Xanthobacteraceae bacterium]